MASLSAAASETDLSRTQTWNRTSFSKSFRRNRKQGAKKGSDAGSIASSADGSLAVTGESPYLRRSSTDSGRKLSDILKGKRSKNPLSRGGSESGSDVISRRPSETTAEGPSTGAEDGNDLEYYTEEEDDTLQKSIRPTLSAHNSHIGFLTASSPLITTETVDSSPPPNTQDTPVPSTSRSQTLKAPPSSARRSPSPVGRLKEAFKAKRRETSPTKVAETESIASGPAATEPEARGRARKDSLSRQIFEDRLLSDEPAEKTPSPAKSRKPRDLVTTLPSTPPLFNVSPATVVTPPTPTDLSHSRHISADSIKAPEFAHTVAPPADASGSRALGISHRRIKSAGQPSKLSSAISAPLTPALEEVKTPGGTLTSPIGAGGFFSSMFSAAQTAANSLTNSITTTGVQNRNRSFTDPKVGQTGGEEVILSPASAQKHKDALAEEGRKQLAIETLGTGNLSLSHLGISDSENVSPMNSTTELVSGIRRDEAAAKAEDASAARAVSMAYSEQTNGDRPNKSQTPSVADTTEITPTPTVAEETGSVVRAGSVRSRISNRRRARTRGSSAATGMTMAPTISGPGSTIHKLPGFSVAASKRQKDFHALFRSVPEDDYLIEDYSAALQRDILLHGRIYISEGHVCFSSNILGWVTTLIMSFDEIISVEKKATAMIFQNGIIIQTLQAKNVFASLLTRDTTYDLIVSIWKITHPNLRSTLNGAPVDGTNSGDKTEKMGSPAQEESDLEEVYDEDVEEDDDDGGDEEGDGSFMEANEGSTVGSETVDTAKVAKRLSSNPLGPILQNGQAKIIDSAEAVATGATATADFPGPATHTATECGDSSSHLERLLFKDTIPAPLGKIYSLMFGPASGKFMRKWLIEDQKSLDLQLEDDGKGLDNEHKSMSFSYIKPLSGSIGPKQTKCIINSTLDQFDLSKAVTVSCATQNPDVPSGNIFVVKTRYCLSWGPNNSTKYIATCQIEWSGKSWLKGPIEKGANDGQLQYQKDIVAALKAAVQAKTASRTVRGKKGGKRRKDAGEVTPDLSASKSSSISKTPEPHWGLFEPLRGPLGPIADLISPTFIIALLILTTSILWFRLSSAHAATTSFGLHSPQRVIAYEELWRREESELWKWIEQRAGVAEGGVPSFLSQGGGKGVGNGKKVGAVGIEMEDRRMEEAVRVTRERLEGLVRAVAGEREKRRKKEGKEKKL